jgi:hypothetical protein
MTTSAHDRHQLLLYRDATEFGDAVGPQKAGIMREALGRDAPNAAFVDPRHFVRRGIADGSASGSPREIALDDPMDLRRGAGREVAA